MALIIMDDIELKLEFINNNGSWSVNPSAHYTISAEEYPSCHMRKGFTLTLSPVQETQILNFAKNVVLPKIKEHEGISNGD